MARSGIRYEDVKEAAETLLGRGLSPTIQRVREILGTGSNTTISDHLRRWQQRMAEAPRAVLPPALPEGIMTALEIFWKTAVQYAEAAFDAQRAAAAQSVVEAEHTRDQAVASAEQAHQAAAEAHHQREAAQKTARELADRLLIEQERRTAAEVTIVAAEQRAEAAQATVAQIRVETEARVRQLDTALHQQHADMEQQRIEAQQRFAAERQRGEASEARLLQHIDQARQEQIAERQQFAAERQGWKNQELTLHQQHDALRQENLQLRTALAATEARYDVSSKENNHLQNLIFQTEARHLDAVRNTEALRAELKAARIEQERLQQQWASHTSPSPLDSN